jgi:hypothetical protein
MDYIKIVGETNNSLFQHYLVLTIEILVTLIKILIYVLGCNRNIILNRFKIEINADKNIFLILQQK